MNAVLISIRPEWVKKILDGEKTVEVRKTAPKLTPPFKCYIYCTLSGSNELFRDILNGDVAEWNRGKWADRKGNVVAEFTCDRVDQHTAVCLVAKEDRERVTAGSCLTAQEIRDYVRGGRATYDLAELPDFYCWHISNLKIYRNPVDISKFCKPGVPRMHDVDDLCDYCGAHPGICGGDWCGEAYGACIAENFALSRPPQSWCYVENVEGG